MTTVLVLRALGLGDALTALPALRGLRRRWPGSELVLAAPSSSGAWLAALGFVDRVVPGSGLEPLSWSGPPPDVAVNLHGRGPQSHRLLTELSPGRIVAFASEPAGVAGPRWVEEEHEVDRWIRLVRGAGGDCSVEDLRLDPVPALRGAGPVVIHPGAAARSRRWPAERWATVAQGLVAMGHRVVVTGTTTERAECETVADGIPHENRCGRDDLSSLSELVASAALVLCGDTGLAHLATAHATPSVVLFGPVSPTRWGPRIDRHLHTVLWRPRPDDPDGDPHGTALDPRLARIEAEDVLAEAERLLAQLSRPPAPVP